MKRIALCFLVVLALAGALYAGGGQSKSGSGPYQLTFWTFQDLHREFMEDAEKTWNQKNPTRQISLKTEVYAYDDMHNKLLIALQTGQGAPDLVDIEIGRFANYLQGSKIGLEPLNDVIEPFRSNIITARFDNYGKNGNWYGIDYHVGATVVFYNKEIMNAAGVNIDDIKTWDDYARVGQQVKQRTGKYMTAYETTEHWSIYPMMNQRGSDVFAADGTVILDNNTNTEILQYMLANIKSGIAVKCPGGFMHSEEWYGYMNQGNVASILMPAWYLNRFTDYMPDLKGKMTIRPMPIFKSGDKRSAGMGGTGTSVTAQAKDKQLVKDFLAFAKLDRDQSIKTWTILGFDPLRHDVWTDPVMKARNKFTDYYGTDIFDILYPIRNEFNPVNLTPFYPQGITVLQKSVMPAALESESKTPAQALKDGAAELRALK
jgi:arabinosaccharide transport system substrate-binding protein